MDLGFLMGESFSTASAMPALACVQWTLVPRGELSTDNAPVSGLFALPQGTLQTLRLDNSQQGFALKDDPLKGKVKWQIKRFETR